MDLGFFRTSESEERSRKQEPISKVLESRYTGWSESWGLALAFAVTQSLERSENAVADAIVALITAEREGTERLRYEQNRVTPMPEQTPGYASSSANSAASVSSAHPVSKTSTEKSATTGKATTNYVAVQAIPGVRTPLAPQVQASTHNLFSKLPSSSHAARFASAIWEAASKSSYRGTSPDSFFRMPAIARAAVALKVQAKFSRDQIAKSLGLKIDQTDELLENARLQYSGGKSWLGQSPDLFCTAVQKEHLAFYFAGYVGGDLDQETDRQLNIHLLDCTPCRKNLESFKRQYMNWTTSLPMIDVDPKAKKHWKKLTRSALKANRFAGISASRALLNITRHKVWIEMALILGAVYVCIKILTSFLRSLY